MKVLRVTIDVPVVNFGGEGKIQSSDITANTAILTSIFGPDATIKLIDKR